MKNDHEAPWFRVETRDCSEQGRMREKESEGGSETAQGVKREVDGQTWGGGGTGTAKTVADWRPRARLRILGVMPMIRGFGAQ